MLGLLLLVGSVPGVWNFEQAPVGRPPDGFEIVATQGLVPRWEVQQFKSGHVLAQTEATPEDKPRRHSFAMVEGATYGDVTLRARIRILTEGGSAGLVFRYQDKDNNYHLVLNSAQRRIRLLRTLGGNVVSIHGVDDVDLEPNVWYELKVRLKGASIAARFYGLRLFEAQDRSLPESGRIGFFCDDHSRAQFDDLRVTALD